jgi:hypothetical protein
MKMKELFEKCGVDMEAAQAEAVRILDQWQKNDVPIMHRFVVALSLVAILENDIRDMPGGEAVGDMVREQAEAARKHARAIEG